MAAPDRVIGRYELADLVAESDGSQLWRAHDPVLNRAVAVRLVGAHDPRRAELRAAARTAAAVTDRRIVHVLDVIDAPDGGLAIVTEWITGRSLAELAREPLAPAIAAGIALEVCHALQSAHAAGIAHGRVQPGSVVICDTGPRLRGLGIDAVLFGVTPGTDPFAADRHAVGAVLHAGLTGRWPGQEADGLPSSPLVGSHLLAPGRLVAGVPRALDEVVARTVVDAVPPRDRPRYPDLDAVAAALAAATGAGQPAPARPRRHHRLRATIGVLLALAGTGVVAALGLALLASGPGAAANTGKGEDRSILFTPVVTKVPVPTTTPAGTGLPIVAISEFNPYGSGPESPDPATLAVDGDQASAWHTATYPTATLGGKRGVGLLLDLGTPRPVSSVELNLVGNGTDLQLRAGNTAPTSPTGLPLVLTVSGAGPQIELRAPNPVTARYVLIWLTKLPSGGTGYRGGIAEVTVYGS